MALTTRIPFKTDLFRLQYDQSYHRSCFNSQSSSLPEGFPNTLATALSWNGPTLTDDCQYTYVLTDDHVLEIEAALAIFKGMQCQLTRQLLHLYA